MASLTTVQVLRAGVAVACEVDLWGLAIAEYVEEGYVYDRVFASGTCLGKGSLAAVLTSVDVYASGVRGFD